MKGFIEVESKEGVELLNVTQIISVCANCIVVKAICDDGYVQGNVIVRTNHTYDEIKQKIAEAINE